jgi:UDP-2,3-diacylglucosamine pyrophosphatase LpxH
MEPAKAIIETLRLGFQYPPAFLLGVLIGTVWALVLSMTWIALAGPIQELFLEKLVDPIWKSAQINSAKNAESTGKCTVIVSDLHIDTWVGANENKKVFLEFLSALKCHPCVQGFVLAGDLRDIPRHPLNPPTDPVTLEIDGKHDQFSGVLSSESDDVLEKLLMLNIGNGEKDSIARVTMMTGNHDIGISGLRYVRADIPEWLPKVQISWSPSILIRNTPDGKYFKDRWVYIEHGHHGDPFLWIYLRYALLDLTRAGAKNRELQIAHGFQRGGQVGQVGISRNARLEFAHGRLTGGNSHFEDSISKGTISSWHIKEILIKLRYRQAARKTFRKLRFQLKSRLSGTVTYGHTHVPDRYEFPGGNIYINSGDWAGNSWHRCYSVIDSDGFVRGPYQWYGDSGARFEASSTDRPPEA